jgi:hypothetical protein
MYDGLKNNLSPAERTELQGQLDQFSATFRAAGDRRKGDRIAQDWQPGHRRAHQRYCARDCLAG